MNKILFTLAVLTMTMSSCSTYYYSILDTTNRNTECIENGDFLYQNDSLWIAYNFGGENAPVKITVFNKLDIPLCVDWTKSALIIDNIAESYASKDVPFYGLGVTETVNVNHHVSVSYKEFGGLIEGSEGVSYVFPQTMVSKKFMNIYADYKKIKDAEFEKIELSAKNNKKNEVKKINFPSDDTPLKFKSFLTTYYDIQQPNSYQTEFYLAGLIKTSNISPNNLPENMVDKGNIFYRQDTNNTGWYVVGGVAAAAFLALPFILTDDIDMSHPNF